MNNIENLRKVVSTPFKKKGKESVGKRAFVFSLALDLNWFSLDEAKQVIEIAKEKNLLKEEDDNVFPNFSIEDANASLSFQPNSGFIEEIKKEKDSLLSQIVDRIQEKEDLTKKEIISGSNEIQNKMEKLVDIEVATLLFAKEIKVDVSDLVDRKLSQL